MSNIYSPVARCARPWRTCVAARLRLSVAASISIAVLSSHANGAAVGLQLVLDPATPGCTACTLSGPGTWNLLASADNAPNNFGISGFSIRVLNVATVFNRSPRAQIDPDGLALPAGFQLARSAANAVAIPNGFLISGAQDSTFSGSTNLVRGFGQESNSFAARFPNLTVASPQTQVSWNAILLLAEGSYNPGPTPLIDFANIDTIVAVFPSASGLQTIVLDPVSGLFTNPRIRVFGNSNQIIDGDNSPSLTDDTNFGTVTAGVLHQRTYTVANPGSAALTLQPPTLTGPYSLVGAFPSSIPVNGSASFTIGLNANAGVGIQSGSISFGTNVTGVSPFNFSLQAQVIPEPTGFAAAAMGFTILMGSIRRARRGKL